tara:strand:- start:854 stop:1090 length:237 start_codon:yes stop_codon:yes gene_type:complete
METRQTVKQQTVKNSKDIAEIKRTLTRLETNHIHHIEQDIKVLKETTKNTEAKLWWILSILVASTVVGVMGERILSVL